MDLLLRGDRIVTPQGIGAYDIAIESGVIKAVAVKGAFDPSEAKRTVETGEKIVMPGGIDPHVHCLWPIPNLDGTSGLTDPPSVVSRAALFGGTTTLIDFARVVNGQSISDTLAKRDQEWAGQCYSDYSYHIMLEGRLAPEILPELAKFIRAGYPTVKIFTTDITPSRRGRMIHFGDIWEIFRVAATEGGLCVMHCEDNDIVMHMYDRLIREGRTGFEHLADVHNVLSEDLSFRRVIRLAEEIGNVPVYFMHVSAASGVLAIREARARGTPIYGETLPQYLMYTADDYRRPNGQIYHTYPSLKSKKDQAALWEGMESGLIHTIATDELCCKLAVKTQGVRIDDVTGGNAAVEPRLAVMFTEMVGRRGYSVEKFVELTSTNTAKIMGLYPRKGVLAAGSDADIAILDPALKTTVRKEMLHETDYSPWEGHEVDVWPCMTILRGKVVVENGEFKAELSDGKFLRRHISPEIRKRARL